MKYKFSHRSDDGKVYYWESVSRLPGDSRVEQVKCGVDWFWQGRYPELTTDLVEEN